MELEDKKILLDTGDKLFRISKGKINEITITEITVYPTHCVYKDNYKRHFFNRNIGQTYFHTLEEAQNKINEKENITKKRKMLKEYELKLNEEFGIKNHFIVK